MTGLLILLLVGLAAFIALGIEDSRHHRALRAPDQS
ncbi:hypothetical protein M2271_002241 [Streptomyces sp. LBL]|nr:hypothetical protein [Streptomyces sp. LBL]